MEKKRAIVTGGAMGIGAAIIKDLLESGIGKCAILDINPIVGEETVEKYKKQYGNDRVVFFNCDVSKKCEIEQAFKIIMEDFKTLDIVVNNAGIYDEKNWERMLEVNLKGAINGVNLGMNYMGKDHGKAGGIIVNISSFVGVSPMGSCQVYAATKSGIIAMTRVWGLDLHYAETGVKVMALCPGVTNTDMVKNFGITDEETLKVIKASFQYVDQDASDVSRGFMHLIERGEPGSVWVVEGGEDPYELSIPKYQDMKKQT